MKVVGVVEGGVDLGGTPPGLSARKIVILMTTMAPQRQNRMLRIAVCEQSRIEKPLAFRLWR